MAHWDSPSVKSLQKDELLNRRQAPSLPLDARVCIILFFLSLLTPFLLATLPAHCTTSTTPSISSHQPPTLTVISLIYRQAQDQPNIEHNCAMISKTRHRYVVFTDDTSRKYCSLCECRKYVMRNCPCPEGDSGCRIKNPCEKLFFFIDALREFKEMLLLDSDLVILKDSFLEHLAPRTAMHDFLATYGHRTQLKDYSYSRSFNSGLVFIRWLPDLDYDIMKKNLYQGKAGQDQYIISMFVQKYYKNWDTLSWKWHCRGLKALRQTIPPKVCYTLHDRAERDGILASLNMTRSTIP